MKLVQDVHDGVQARIAATTIDVDQSFVSCLRGPFTVAPYIAKVSGNRDTYCRSTRLV